jgi:hypothetical protein
MAYRRRGLGNLTTDLSSAIQRFEGSCPSPDSCRNNNPGNLRAGPGATGVDSRGIAVFPDYQTGEAALQHQVDLNIGRGLSLDEFFGGKTGVYAGYDKTAPNYASTVSGWLGIDPAAPLSSISGPTIADSGPVDDSGDYGGSDAAGLSPVVLAGLVIAGIAAVWAVAS